MIRGRVGRHAQQGGRHCQNWPDDQKFVIGLLNNISPNNGGTWRSLDGSIGGRIVDGMASDALYRAILTFEDKHFPGQRSGYVDPGGRMLKRMQELEWKQPQPKLVFEDGIDQWNELMGSGTDLGKAIVAAEHSHHSVHSWHFKLDVAHFALMALEIAGAHLVELGIGGAAAAVVSGPLMGILNFMALGMGHMDAIDNTKTDRVRRGLSQGIILAAAREGSSFVRANFVFKSEEHSVTYPEQNKNFQNAYLWGLTRGLEYGKKLTKHERKLLFKQIDSYPQALSNPGGFYADRANKTESERVDYYIVAAAKLKHKSGGG